MVYGMTLRLGVKALEQRGGTKSIRIQSCFACKQYRFEFLLKITKNVFDNFLA